MAHEHAPAYVAGIRVLRNQELVSHGSGLLVSPRHVVTCLHVVLNAIEKLMASMPARGSLDEPLPSALARGLENVAIEVAIGIDGPQRRIWRQARCLHEDLHADLVVLELDRPILGIAPPPLCLADYRAETPVAYRMDNGDVRRTVLPRFDRTASHFGDSSNAAPAMIQHDHTAMAGNSGGPIIVEINGAHHLVGIATMGGLGFPTGVMTTAARLSSFLQANGIQMAATTSEARVGGGTSAVPPGIAFSIELAVSGMDAMVFDSCIAADGAVFFRASRPITAERALHLAEKQVTTGAALLPAHAATGEQAATILAQLSCATGQAMRLPRFAEIGELRRRFGASLLPMRFGLPTTLEQFCHAGGPPVFAEWIEGPKGRPAIVFCDEDSIKIVASPDEAALSPLTHPRIGVQPVLVLE